MSGISKGLVAILILMGVGTGIYLSTNKKPEINKPVTKPTPNVSIQKEEKVKIYQVVVKNNKCELVPTEKSVKTGGNPKEKAITGLIEQGDTDGMVNPIPRGTKLLSLKVQDGIAFLNLSKDFRDNFSGGSEEESLIIGTFLKTLGQFPDVKRVKFLVEGESLDTLGHFDLSTPQDVNWIGT